MSRLTVLTKRSLFLRIDNSLYTDFKTHQPIVTPSVGIGNLLHVCYGYSVHPAGNPFQPGRHQQGLSLVTPLAPRSASPSSSPSAASAPSEAVVPP